MRSEPRSRITLYGHDGRRKYLTPVERLRFIDIAWRHSRPEVASFCLILAFTGCRISEALAIRGIDLNRDDRFVALRSLKKRNDVLVREIPLPDELIAHVVATHAAQVDTNQRLWSWSRSRAWRLVKLVLAAGGIAGGPHCTAKGLRHAFGIHAIRQGVPLNMVQRWLGHASIATTAIYTQALGAEERELAARLWTRHQPCLADRSRPE